VAGVSIVVPAGGTGIRVPGGVTFAVISGVAVTGNATSTGVLVQSTTPASSAASASLLNSQVHGNNIGVNVAGGIALLQGDNLDNNTAGDGTTATGLLVQNGAVVDAGQLPGSAAPLPNGPAGNNGYYGNITGLATAGGSSAGTNHSTGGNSFAGYTASTSQTNPAVPQAIRDLNTGTAPFAAAGVELSNNYAAAGPQLGRMDLAAQNNTFGSATTLFQVEQVIFHDLDNSGDGFVSYGTPAVAPATVTATVQYLAHATLGGPANGAGTLVTGSAQGTEQMSVIRYIRVTYSSYVFLDPNLSSATSNLGLNLVKLSGPYGAPGGTLIHATVASATYDPATGSYTVVYAFSGAGTELGSLEDGDYSLQFTAGAVQGGGPGGPALGASASVDPSSYTALFHRFFGDFNGDGHLDNTDFFWFRSTFGLSSSQTGFLAAFDYDGSGVIDNTDFFKFRARFGTSLP
jgi:hypothetical protein